MEEFLDYVKKSETDFVNRVKGATPAEVAEFEALTGLTFPSIYKEFLLFMGKDSGQMDLTFGGTTNIDELMERYREFPIEEGDIPEGTVCIGCYGQPIGSQLVLECQVPTGTHRVLLCEDDYLLGVRASSLECLLFRWAFVPCEIASFATKLRYVNSNTERQLTEASALALELGYEKHWFSDETEFCGAKLGSAILVNQYDYQGLAITIAGEVNSELKEIGRRFSREFSMEQMDYK